jgi:hypothetical protein
MNAGLDYQCNKEMYEMGFRKVSKDMIFDTTIFAGPNRDPFLCHRKVLGHYSDYLKGVLKAKDVHHRLPMDDGDPNAMYRL